MSSTWETLEATRWIDNTWELYHAAQECITPEDFRRVFEPWLDRLQGDRLDVALIDWAEVADHRQEAKAEGEEVEACSCGCGAAVVSELCECGKPRGHS